MRAIALILIVPILSGCIGSDEDTAAGGQKGGLDSPISDKMPAQGIDWTMLSPDSYEMTEPRQEYVESHDGIMLHIVIHLPDGDGPWPTILQNSPYYTHPAGGVTTIGLAETYVPKGFAVVSADVRGTGNSEGCMNMMGEKERKDTYVLVEWIAEQDWSTGRVGMQGVSYVGTTPHEALIEAPPHLDTVVTVAGVVNQWRNVYQGGVPYQGRFYPVTYETTEGAPPPSDFNRGAPWVQNTLEAGCEQDEPAEQMSPGKYEKGAYSHYWHERNFTRHVDQAKASLLYSQGFVDRAVNPMEAVGWFNELPIEKKAFLHQGGHQYPPREDYAETELAWFDYWLKDIDNGIMQTPTVETQLNDGRILVQDEWPPTDVIMLRWHLEPTSSGGLSVKPSEDGRESYYGGPSSADESAQRAETAPSHLTFESPPLEYNVTMSGSPLIKLAGSIAAEPAADNAYWLFQLYDVAPNGTTVSISEGWFNAHLKGGFDRIEPLEPDTEYRFPIRFEPRDYLFKEGHHLRLEANGYDSRVSPWDEPLVLQSIHYGSGVSYLEIPMLKKPVIYDAPPEVTDEDAIPDPAEQG